MSEKRIYIAGKSKSGYGGYNKSVTFIGLTNSIGKQDQWGKVFPKDTIDSQSQSTGPFSPSNLAEKIKTESEKNGYLVSQDVWILIQGALKDWGM